MLYDPNSYFFKSFLSYGGATAQKAKAKADEKKDDDEKKDGE